MLEIIPEFRAVYIDGKRADGYWAVVNPETGYVYDIVSRRYKIVPHNLVYTMVRKTINDDKILMEKLETSKKGARMLYDVYYDRWDIDGDKFFFGIRVTNSYDRSLRLGVMLSLFRLVCSNGLVFPQHTFATIKMKHSKGLSAMDIYDAVKKVTSKREVIGGIIKKAISYEIGNEENEKFKNILTRKKWQKEYRPQRTAWDAYNEVTAILWKSCNEPLERHRLLERSFGLMEKVITVG